jgi:hypothetical protein
VHRPFSLPVRIFISTDNVDPVHVEMALFLAEQYQQASCEQLWGRKGQPKLRKKHDAIQILRNDLDKRSAFFNRVADPIANYC